MPVDTGPHSFAPLKRWRNRGRCRSCMLHEDFHVNGRIEGWNPARFIGQNDPAIDPIRDALAGDSDTRKDPQA